MPKCCLRSVNARGTCENDAVWMSAEPFRKGICNRGYKVHLRCEPCFQYMARSDQDLYTQMPKCCLQACENPAVWRDIAPSGLGTCLLNYVHHLRCSDHTGIEDGWVLLYPGAALTNEDQTVKWLTARKSDEPAPPPRPRQGRRQRRHLEAPSSWDDIWDE